MLGKYSVKKPYTVIVGVILIIVLGVISFTRMTTDLLPNMNFPYVVVYTTYIGATPEQVEEEVTRPMEAAFATLTEMTLSGKYSISVSVFAADANSARKANSAHFPLPPLSGLLSSRSVPNRSSKMQHSFQTLSVV